MVQINLTALISTTAVDYWADESTVSPGYVRCRWFLSVVQSGREVAELCYVDYNSTSTKLNAPVNRILFGE